MTLLPVPRAHRTSQLEQNHQNVPRSLLREELFTTGELLWSRLRTKLAYNDSIKLTHAAVR